MSASLGAPIPQTGVATFVGISGSFQSESGATFDWNRWQGSTGISGNLRAEYARCTHDTGTACYTSLRYVPAIPGVDFTRLPPLRR